VLLSVLLLPMHAAGVPDIAEGKGLTVTRRPVMQPVGSV
jgi:hypothetical protein